MTILREAAALTGGVGLVFPGTKAGKPLSDMTLSKLVKELGFAADIHGFRQALIIGQLLRAQFLGLGEVRGEVGIVLRRNPDRVVGADAARALSFS